jgi:hypothetical protein
MMLFPFDNTRIHAVYLVCGLVLMGYSFQARMPCVWQSLFFVLYVQPLLAKYLSYLRMEWFVWAAFYFLTGWFPLYQPCYFG